MKKMKKYTVIGFKAFHITAALGWGREVKLDLNCNCYSKKPQVSVSPQTQSPAFCTHKSQQQQERRTLGR